MTKSRNNNYFAEIQTLMPNQDLLEKFGDPVAPDAAFKAVYTDSNGTIPTVL